MPARRILLVGDSTASRALDRTLPALGYEVTGIAVSGRDAIGLAERAEPDVALVDVGLQGDVDAVDTARELRLRWHTPVVLIAGDPNDPTLHRARATSLAGHLLVPFTDRELLLTIELALSRRDVTSQVRALEDRFFSISIDMLCFLDFNGYFKRLNPAWERTLGFTREELMSRPFIEFVHPDDRARTLAQNRAVRRGGKAVGFENRYLCKDGSYRWLLWNAAPDAPEQVIYSVARDVTDRKLAEEERERLVHELQEALAEVQMLQAILPICSYCRHVRDDTNYWQSVESYVGRHTNTRFSHSICPSCYERVVRPQLDEMTGP